MELQIKGQKYLNGNRYQRIRMRNINQELEKGMIDVQVKNKVKPENSVTISSMPTSTPKFMDTIKDLSEIEKIEEILEYFARNNTIDKMVEENGIHFFSNGGRQLDIEMGFKVENKVCLENAVKKLIYNYLDSRLQFLDSCQDCSFEIVGNNVQSFYEAYEDLDGSNETVWLYLMSDKEELYDFGKLRNFEKSFIENFVLEKIREQGVPAIVEDYWRLGKEEDRRNMKINSLNVHVYSIFCGDIVFHFHRMAVEDLRDLTHKVIEYNENLEQQESMQLKLDLGGTKI